MTLRFRAAGRALGLALLAVPLASTLPGCGDDAPPVPMEISAKAEPAAEITPVPTGRKALEAARGVAQSTLRAAEAALTETESEIEEARGDLLEAEADLVSAQQQVERARQRLTAAESSRVEDQRGVAAARDDLLRLVTPDPLLFRAVQTALLEESELDGTAILARVERGRVVLEGKVVDTKTRDAAARITTAVPGVIEVINRIQVVEEKS